MTTQRNISGIGDHVLNLNREIRRIDDPEIRFHLVNSRTIQVKTGISRRGRKGIAPFQPRYNKDDGWHIRLGRGAKNIAVLTVCEIHDGEFIYRARLKQE